MGCRRVSRIWLAGVYLFMLWGSLPSSVSAQDLTPEQMADLEAVGDVVAAAADAAASSISEAELEQRRRADALTIQNAMKQLERSPDASLAEQLPQPQFVGSSEIEAALVFPTAWRTPALGRHSDRDYHAAISSLVRRASWLYFDEWSCSTGQEIAIARQIVDLIPRLVTAYPERLMLRVFIVEREALGFPRSKKCERDLLTLSRSKYHDELARVLEKLE